MIWQGGGGFYESIWKGNTKSVRLSECSNYQEFNVYAKHTVNPRISPLGAYLFFIFLDGGLFERGLIRGGGAYKIIVDIIKRLRLF